MDGAIMAKRTALQELEARGLVQQVTHRDELEELFEKGPVTVYCGFDPTAESLHIGNLFPVMMLAHLQKLGHRPITVVGGATGMIGDPSGKDAERQLLTPEHVAKNCDGLRDQLSGYLEFGEGESEAVMVNNHDWIGPFSFIDWLREVGKYFTVNSMIAKESVKRRLDNREQGITFTEFSYQMLQGYDFMHLRREMNCQVQVGGNDQWGNITAGCDLTHKMLGERVYAITCPLMTTASGEKFGKSAGNAIWVDPELTSPYEFYQYWIQVEDADVEKWLKVFTFLSIEEIEAVVAEHGEATYKRIGQKRLAEEVTRIVHGQAGLDSALKATNVLFGGEISGFTDKELRSIFADVPSSERSRSELDGEGIAIVDLLAETVCASKGEARRLLKQGGANLNNAKVGDDKVVTAADLASESSLVLRSGKKKYHVVWYTA